MLKPRVGDMVTLKPFRVIEVSAYGSVKLDMHPQGWVASNDIASIEPRALQVGDRVETGLWTGTIAAIDTDEAWVKGLGIAKLRDLTRVEDKP